jgi:hypothetical protein
MSRIVDPSPWIAARLDELALQYQPLIADLDERVRATTDRGDRRRLRRDRRQTKRRYRQARAEVQRMRMLPW